MLRKHSNKGMGKGCVKKAKKRSEIFHFIILAMLKGYEKGVRELILLI